MTTVVTRLYDDAAHADAVVAALKVEGFPESALDVIEQRSRTSAEDQITDAGVPANVAQQYAQHLTSSRALLVVRAPFVPFGAAKRAIEEADKYPSYNAGVANQNLNVPDQVDRELFLSILPSHRLFLTGLYELRNNLKPRGLSNAFRIPLLAKRKKKRMRPAVIQRQFFAPKRMNHRRTSRKLLMDRFFGGPLPQTWDRRPPRQDAHFRVTN
ncbi:hypothetical protein [Hasllibacter sp. MH4015]|uniref:hypothetical protein n=1 Tax=Hasllibacter sp. MH4015 TaxID=2854029 RepID=UPI001CD71219|nr:hypothetical protein [Hasllibacter sp. MH4015]